MMTGKTINQSNGEGYMNSVVSLCRCLSRRGSQVEGKIISGLRNPSRTAIRSAPVLKAWFISKKTIYITISLHERAPV